MVAFTEYYITSNDGTRIAVYDYNLQANQTVFLIHGWPLSHRIFEYQINRLTDCGYRVVAVDFSMGGAIALRYMNCHKGWGVCKLILLSAAAPCFAQHPGFLYGKKVQEVDDLIQLAGADRPQHRSICGSKLITLSESGHGTMYDQLEPFNMIFMDSISGTFLL